MLSLFQMLPGAVDVRHHLAFDWQVGLLVVCAHLALYSEEQYLQVALLNEPISRSYRQYILLRAYEQ